MAADLMVPAPALTPQQADNDAEVIRLWLHGRSPHTQRAYQGDIDAFLAFCPKPLRQVALRDVQGFLDSLDGLASATQARRVGAVKSLISYAHRIGYLPFDVAIPVRSPSIKNTL